MPSADSRYTISAPCGLLTRKKKVCRPLTSYLCVPLGSSTLKMRCHADAGSICYPANLLSGNLCIRHPLPRCSGSPRVSSGYFQRTIVGSTRFNHTTDIGLRPVGRTRPGLPRLLSACPPPFGAGHTCSSTHAFASGFLRASLAAQHPCLWLPFASVRLGLDFDRYLCYNTGHHHLAARPCLAHPGVHRALAPRNSVLIPGC